MEGTGGWGNELAASGGRIDNQKGMTTTRGGEIGKVATMMVCGTLVYYHCAYRNSSFISLLSDVFIVILCSLAILGLLFRQLNISVPVDPLDWQISQDTANTMIASLANTVGAAESVLRVAATGHDKRLFIKVVLSLYVLSVMGRSISGVTVAYAVYASASLISSCIAFLISCRSLTALLDSDLPSMEPKGLCLFCLYMFAESSQTISSQLSWWSGRRDGTIDMQDSL